MALVNIPDILQVSLRGIFGQGALLYISIHKQGEVTDFKTKCANKTCLNKLGFHFRVTVTHKG